MHVEVRLHLSPFLLEEHRQQEARAEPAAERGEKPRAPTGPKLWMRMAMRCEQVAPDHYMPVFDIGQTRVDVLLFGVGLRGRQQTIEVRRIRFVLPMMLEGMDVDLRALGRRLGGLERRRHDSISPKPVGFCTGNP